MEAAREKKDKIQLRVALGLSDATLLVIGSVIGSGIFLTSGIIAGELPSVAWIMLVWLIGSFLSLSGGLTLAELGAMMPEAGGQYIYLREAYGPMAGFLYGWLTFLVTQTGGIAALAIGFAEYVSLFYPAMGLNVSAFSLEFLEISFGQLIAVSSIIILTIINYFGIKSGSMVQNFFTILKLVAILVLIIGGFIVTTDSQTMSSIPSPILPQGMNLIAAIGVALIAVLWTFDGWYAVNSVASEIKNPQRNLPLSLLIGISVIGIVYILINIFYLKALPISEIAGVVRIGEKATNWAFGPSAGTAMAGLILISILGCLSATVIYGPRIYYAMARDGLFFKKFTFIHPRFRTPTFAITWQGIWSVLLCLTGGYEALFTYVVFTSLLFYMASAAGVFVLRKKRPDANRPYRVWAYPLLPSLFGLSMFLIAANSIIEKPVESIFGLIFLIIGIPVYFYWHRK
jgi:APA family basic amino acid/polyamine antiporter